MLGLRFCKTTFKRKKQIYPPICKEGKWGFLLLESVLNIKLQWFDMILKRIHLKKALKKDFNLAKVTWNWEFPLVQRYIQQNEKSLKDRRLWCYWERKLLDIAYNFCLITRKITKLLLKSLLDEKSVWTMKRMARETLLVSPGKLW